MRAIFAKMASLEDRKLKETHQGPKLPSKTKVLSIYKNFEILLENSVMTAFLAILAHCVLGTFGQNVGADRA